MDVDDDGDLRIKNRPASRDRRRLRQKWWRAGKRECHWCRQTLSISNPERASFMTVDHVLPISKGGRNYQDNLVPACGRCNSSRAQRMKIWLDDMREPPDQSWIWVKKPDEAIAMLRYGATPVTDISLDYDLEGFATGYPVARYLGAMVLRDGDPKIRVVIHSMNPVGVERLAHELETGLRSSHNIESVLIRPYHQGVLLAAAAQSHED